MNSLNQTNVLTTAAPPAKRSPRDEAAPETTSRRYYALDSLRGSMMLLGIYLHSVVGYSREGGWPYKDPHPTAVYDWSLGYIHAFRMPIFYVMAGFFAAFLTYRRGLVGFLKNRAQRILIPFVVGWVLLYPVVIALATYARAMDQPDVWSRVYRVLSSGEILRHLHPLHLWFLEYLLFLYVLQVLALWLVPRVLPAGIRSFTHRVFRLLLQSPWKPLLMAVPMFFTLCLSREGFLEDPPGFAPVFRILLPYSIVFAFGWLLYKNVDLLPKLQRLARTQVAVTLLILAPFLFIGPWMDQHRAAARLVIAGATSLIMWLLIFGLTGVFLRYLDRPMPRMRYLADSSYWLYIVHMPGLMVFQILLKPVPWPAALKVWLALACAIPPMLLAYHFCVRPTVIGQVLNGRRYGRELPGTGRKAEQNGQPRSQGVI